MLKQHIRESKLSKMQLMVLVSQLFSVEWSFEAIFTPNSQSDCIPKQRVQASFLLTPPRGQIALPEALPSSWFADDVSFSMAAKAPKKCSWFKGGEMTPKEGIGWFLSGLVFQFHNIFRCPETLHRILQHCFECRIASISLLDFFQPTLPKIFKITSLLPPPPK